MFNEKFKKLEDLRSELAEVEAVIGQLRPTKYYAAYKQLYRIACHADRVSDFKYAIVLAKMERAVKCLCPSVLNSCARYAESLINMSEDYLKLQIAEEYFNSKKVQSEGASSVA